MKHPPLESWLEALDDGSDAGAPPGAHDDCPTCAATQAEARALLQGIAQAAPPSPVTDDEFVARVLAALPADSSPAARPRRRRFVAWGLGVAGPLAAAAVVLLALAIRPQPPRDDLPVARGGTDEAAPFCDVAIAREEGLQYLTDGAHVPANASLAFRVRHEGPDPAWLGVFAVTGDGRVAWYHPAYESAADDPRTLRLDPAPEAQVLPQRVTLPLGEGEVRIVCWKSDHEQPIRRADALVEQAVTGLTHPARLPRVPALGGEQQGLTLWFEAER